MKLSFLYGATFGTMIRLLVRHKFRVSLVRLPALLLHLSCGLFNSALSLPDLFRRKRGTPKKIVFILGHYRSGTTHLLNLLSADGLYVPPTTYQAVFPGSFLFTEKWLAPLFNKIGPGVRAMDNMPMRMESPQEEEIAMAALGAPTPYLAVHFPVTGIDYASCISFKKNSVKQLERWKKFHLRFVQKLAKKHGPDVLLVLKSPANTARVKLLLDLYPDARFVFIHRDPYRTIQSSMHLYDTWYKMCNFQAIGNLKKDRDQTVLNVFEEINREWLDQKHLIPPGRLTTVSFLELQARPVETMDRIYKMLGDGELNKLVLQKYLDGISSFKKNEYESLTPELVSQINGQLGFVFDEFGYAKVQTT